MDIINWAFLPFEQLYLGYRGEHDSVAFVVTFVAQLVYMASVAQGYVELVKWIYLR